MSELREECGVFGIFASDVADVASTAYYGLYALQHRGQESCGIVVNNDGLFRSHKDAGLVEEVFTQPALASLGQGSIAWAMSATARPARATPQRAARGR